MSKIKLKRKSTDNKYKPCSLPSSSLNMYIFTQEKRYIKKI